MAFDLNLKYLGWISEWVYKFGLDNPERNYDEQNG